MIKIPSFQIRLPSGEAWGQPFDLSFSEGQVVVIKGPNGAGKSSFLRTFFQRFPDRSVLLAQNIEIQDLPPLRVSEIGDFLGSVAGASPVRTEGLFDPQGKDRAWAASSVTRVSGGQVRRALLAALLQGPSDFLLLDEPETHLDEASRALLPDLFRDFAAYGRRNILWVTHESSLPEAFPILNLQKGGRR